MRFIFQALFYVGMREAGKTFKDGSAAGKGGAPPRNGAEIKRLSKNKKNCFCFRYVAANMKAP